MKRVMGSVALVASLALPAAAAEAPKLAANTKKEDVAIQQIDQQIAKAGVDKSKPDWRTKVPKFEKVTFDANRKYYALMTTNKGPVKIELLADTAPMHATNFIYLSRVGFYDGLAFHRVITDFMAQGGCPLGNGTGGPGYNFDGEFSPSVKHNTGGLLSMANRGPGTDGSQFFLTFKATPWLDGKHTIFGKVVEGMDTLKKLEAAGSQSGQTSEPLKIESVTIQVS
jgi:cyclophilin family peptidyl-prolyl cis-trans isomerase